MASLKSSDTYSTWNAFMFFLVLVFLRNNSCTEETVFNFNKLEVT